MSTLHAQTYEMHSMGRSIYWFTCAVAFAGGVTALVISSVVTDGRWVIMALGLLFMLCALAIFFRPRTVVDSNARIVKRELWLFGRYRAWSRPYPFSDFAAVVLKRVRGSKTDNDTDELFVSLQRRSGSQILASYLAADSFGHCRPAEELAERLSADLEIEIVNR